MNFGLRGGAELPGLFGLIGGYGNRKLRELAAHGQAYADHHGIGPLFRGIVSYATGLQLSFHPAAQTISFRVEGGYIVIEAETLAAGPGYHAFVVGFIDYLVRQHQWTWNFAKATRHFADDTGFYAKRDFTALQTAMAGEFEELRQAVLEAEAGALPCYTLWMPTEIALAAPYFAATSLGFRERAFFEQSRPEQFFPWWDQGVTTQTLKNMVLSKMWLEIDWRPPTTAEETRDLENCRAMIALARQRGVTFTDNERVEDIDTLLRDEWPDSAEDADSVGYWRRDVWYMGPNGWSVGLPAYYRQDYSGNTTACSIHYGDRGVYMTSELYETPVTQLEWPRPQWEGFRECLRFQTDDYWVVVLAGVQPGDEGEDWWTWQGMFLTFDGYAVITAMSRHKDDWPWAEKVLRSAQCDTTPPEPYRRGGPMAESTDGI